MIETVIVVMTSDAWHSNNSKEVVGVASCLEKAIDSVKRYIEKKNSRLRLSTAYGVELIPALSQDDVDNLARICQTQGRSLNFEVQLEIVDNIV